MFVRWWGLFGLMSIFVLAHSAIAASSAPAQLSQLVHQVELVSGDGVVRPGTINDNVEQGTAVRTGNDSRGELKFASKALARLGARTTLSFGKNGREFSVRSGVALIEAGRRVGGTRIRMDGIAAEIGGCIVLFENRAPTYKLIVLHGTARLCRPGHLGDSVLVRAGQMAFGLTTAPVSDPVDFDLERFVKTCRLISDFAPLDKENLLVRESRKQKQEKSGKVLYDTNLVINGSGTLVSLVDPATGGEPPAPPPDASPAPTPLRLAPTLERPIEFPH